MKHKIALYMAMVALVLLIPACGKSTVSTPNSSSSTPNSSSSATGTPANQSHDLVIASTSSYVDRQGNYHIVGEVDNNTDNVLSSIQLTLDIKDASGNSMLRDENGDIMANTIVYPMLYTLAPSEGSPFEYIYAATGGTPASYNVTVTNQQTGDANRGALLWENVQILDDGMGTYFLTGELINTGSQWAHINGLAGAVLDDSNTVLSAGLSGTYATELAPSGDTLKRDRTPFEINFPNPEGVTKWKLYLDGDAIDSVTDYPIDVKVTNTFFDQNGSAHLVGWVTNNSGEPLDSLVVGGLYGVDGTVMDASYSFVPVPMKPGVATPFSISSFGRSNYSPDQAALVKTSSAQMDNGFTSSTPYEIVDLKTSGEALQNDGATWTFSGNVDNTSGKSLSGITVVAMVMDSEGKLVAMEYTSVFPTGDAIAPDETNPFSVIVYLDPGVDITGFSATTMAIGDVK